MQLTLQRYFFSDNYTLGRLYSGNHLICETLEPPSSHLNKHNPLRLIRKAKADGKRAIPKGVYELVMSYSPRFGKRYPRLHGVPGYEGILIHPGNYPADTKGCILPGWNRHPGMVSGSIAATAEIIGIAERAAAWGEKLTLKVVEEHYERSEYFNECA